MDSTHEFASLNTLLLVLVLGLCILSAYLVKVYKFYYLPESAAAILVGLVVGGMARLLYPSKDELDFLSFQPEIFFFLFLPPIIFEAGYTLRKKQVRHSPSTCHRTVIHPCTRKYHRAGTYTCIFYMCIYWHVCAPGSAPPCSVPPVLDGPSSCIRLSCNLA